MAEEKVLMRPLRSDSLKPRPSTQAVWEPRRPSPQSMEQPGNAQAIIPEPVFEPAAEEIPAAEQEPAASVPERPQPVHEPDPVPEPLPLPVEEETEEQQPSPPPYAESIFTFAPAVSIQPEAPVEEPAAPQPEAVEEEEEEPFDLDAVIASILAGDDDADDDEDHPSAQDALPTEEMPEPAAVPLYEAPKPRPRRTGWIWLIGAALIVVASGWAARRFGWLP